MASVKLDRLSLICIILATGIQVVFLEEQTFSNNSEENRKPLRDNPRMQGTYYNSKGGRQLMVSEERSSGSASGNFQQLTKAERNKCPEPRFCQCSISKREITCGKNITYIPVVPSYATTVIMNKALLVNVTKATLKNLKNVSLTKLELSNSRIKNISPEAFSNIQFNVGSTLDLSGNVVAQKQLRDAFCSLQTVNISALKLDSMDLVSLSTDLFLCFKNTNLLTLSLKDNQMKAFSGLTLAPLGLMQILNLTHNNISLIQHPEGLQRLTYLELRHNNFTRVPNFGVDSFGVPITQRLQTLRLSSNSIRYIQPSDFKGLKNLQYLHLKFNNIKTLPGNLLAEMPKLTHILFKGNGLRSIPGTAFNSSYLAYIDLSSNVFHFSTTDTKTLFRLAPNLKTLYLADNYLDISDTRIIELFSPLKNLTRLILENNRIVKVIPPPLIKILPSLQQLILTSNNIASWNPEMFEDAKHLTRLFLDDNKIISVNESSFPKTFLLHLKEINLATNPFACNCDLRWFLYWINTTRIANTTKVVNYPAQYWCNSPKEWQGKHVSKFNPTPEYCASTEINLRLILGSTLGSVALLGTIATVIIIKYRLHIRYCCYVARLKLKRRGYTEIPDGVNYEYDAFVVYSSADRAWVVQTLLPRVENEGIKLCIYDRDFELGCDIVDNVVSFMEASRKVVLVLSDRFAKSEWCQWEMAMAQSKLLDEKREILVLIKLNEIQPRNMTRRLMVLMRDKVYIDWSDQELGREMFWQRLTNALTLLSQPTNA